MRGRRIAAARVVHPIAVRPGRPAQFARAVAGRRIHSVQRRGKYLLIKLDSGWLVAHFRLDGQLLWMDVARRDKGGTAEPHACVRLTLSDGSRDGGRRRAGAELGFVDPRHFGRMRYADQLADEAGVASLGIEPLSPAFTPAALAALLHGSRRPLKLLLLDQKRIAGLGNIYSCESLWRARLSPRRPSNRVTAREARALHKAIVGVLRAALRCCLSPPPDFRDPEWWFQGLEEILRVYGREGRKCRRCGHAIRRIAQGGRSTFFCAHCQR